MVESESLLLRHRSIPQTELPGHISPRLPALARSTTSLTFRHAVYKGLEHRDALKGKDWNAPTNIVGLSRSSGGEKKAEARNIQVGIQP